MTDMLLVETVRSSIPAMFFVSRGVDTDLMPNGIPGTNSTLWLIFLDPEDRLRYSPVSLFFMVCLCSQTRRGVQDNLFHIQFV